MVPVVEVPAPVYDVVCVAFTATVFALGQHPSPPLLGIVILVLHFVPVLGLCLENLPQEFD